MPISSATSGATPSIPRPSRSWRSWAPGGAPRAAPSGGAPAPGSDRRRDSDRRRFRPSADPLQVHRDDAAVGLPRLPRPARASDTPTFDLRMRAEAKGLREEAGRVVGVQAETPDGPLEVRADLVVAADGRGSVLRAAAGLPVKELGAPMDVFGSGLSRRPSDTDRDPRPLRRRAHLRDDQPRRALAVRLCHRQGDGGGRSGGAGSRRSGGTWPRWPRPPPTA